MGQAIKYVIENEPVGSRFGKKTAGEQWIFLSSKDGDIRCAALVRAVGDVLTTATIRDAQATKLIFDKYKPTHVIHLAALVGGLFKNMKYKLTFLRDNMLINENVLWNSKEFNVRAATLSHSPPPRSHLEHERRSRRSSRACRPASSRTRSRTPSTRPWSTLARRTTPTLATRTASVWSTSTTSE